MKSIKTITKKYEASKMDKKLDKKYGEGSKKDMSMDKKNVSKMMKTKPQGKGIVKALGQKKTTGNFKKIEKAKGKGAAIVALQNKLAKHRGLPISFKRK